MNEFVGGAESGRPSIEAFARKAATPPARQAPEQIVNIVTSC